MMKKILFGILALAVIGGAIGFYMFSKEHDETADLEAAFSVTSDQIVQEFLDDQEAASKKYIDQVIEVSGPVYELVKTDQKITGIKLAKDELYLVNASLQTPMSEVSQEELTIKGICAGFLGDSESMLPGGTLELSRATIVNK